MWIAPDLWEEAEGLTKQGAVVRLGAEAETKQQGYIVVVILRE